MSESVNENGLTFSQWMRDVNRECSAICGLSADDLPDWHYWDNWDAGVSAKEAAQEVIENACEDMGMDIEDFGFDF